MPVALAPEAIYRFTATSDHVTLTRLPPVFLAGSMLHTVMALVVALFPLQLLALNVGTSKFDLANIVFDAFAVLLVRDLQACASSSTTRSHSTTFWVSISGPRQ